jgi:putative aldouronate transport system substrate-binding protein
MTKLHAVKKCWLLLTFAVLVGFGGQTAVFAGGSGEKGGQAQQATGKLTTLKILQYELENQQMDFPNLWFYKELEKETGVHVEWDIVKGSGTNWDTQVNLRFASMDLPDLIRTGEIDVEEYGVNQKLVVPLDDYLKDNMPNYYSRLYMNNADKSLTASDGKMYYIGGLIAQNVNHQGNHYINKTWLDKLGLAVPKTIDELTNVLIAFRDRDPNGNGLKDEIPFSAGGSIYDGTQGLYPHFANFGVPLWNNNKSGDYASITKEGKVQFATDYAGFRDAVEWLAMCYREKLLDMESLTQDSNAWAAKVNAGTVGYTAYLRLINTALTTDVAQNFVSLLPPASKYGVSVPRLLEVSRKDAEITSANKYVAQTLQWLDLQLETERMMVSWNGPIKEGGPIPPTMKINADGKYDIISIPANNGLYNIVPVYHALFFAPGDYYSKIYQMPPHRIERYQTSQDYMNAGVMEPGSYTILEDLIKPTNADAIELARLYADINKLMQESIADFIRSGVTQAKYDTFIRSTKNVGVDRYISLLQKYYDNYAAGAK